MLFRSTNNGTGILSTADSGGEVNAAVYGRPYFLEEGTIAFIMNDRRSHQNLQSNPRAVYLFLEDGSKSRGIRLYLQRVREEEDQERINGIRRHRNTSDPSGDGDRKRFLVYFRVEKTRPIVDSL